MKNIFVSSTFRDFQYERDALQEIVSPKLAEIARQYGESVSFCDLRWGVDTTEEKTEEEITKKVLSVCMNEIDRARPYMIVLLGERYGYMPGEKEITHEAKLKELEILDFNISVTALEIEYGSMRNAKDLENTFFYFREFEKDNVPNIYRSENEIYRKKLEELKAKIKAIAGDRVRTYKVKYEQGKVTLLGQFCDLVTEDLKNDMESDWKEYHALNKYQKDNKYHWNIMDEKNKVFKVHEKFAADVIRKISSGQEQPIIITGEEGVGKSTLLSHVCLELMNQGHQVLPFVGGNTTLSTDASHILKSLVWQLEEINRTDHLENLLEETSNQTESLNEKITIESFQKRLNEEAKKLSGNGAKIVIAIDDLDKITKCKYRDGLGFLPQTSVEGIQILLTVERAENFNFAYNLTRMPELDNSDMIEVVESTLKSVGKQLSNKVKQELVRTARSKNLLYLYLAVLRLNLMNVEDFDDIKNKGDGMEMISQKQLEILNSMPKDIKKMAVELLFQIMKRISSDKTEKTVEYLAVSRRGLRTSDLESLLIQDGKIFSQLEFSQLVNYISQLFILRQDGRYDFMHNCLRDGLREGNQQDIHKKMVKHFRKNIYDKISREELVYHCFKADDKKELLYFIEEYSKKFEMGIPRESGNTIYQLAKEGNTTWILDTVEHAKEVENMKYTFISFVNFINLGVGLNVINRKEDEQISLEIYKKLVQQCINYRSKDNSLISTYALLSSYMNYINAVEETDLKLGLSLCQEAIKICKEAYVESQDQNFLRMLPHLYSTAGNIYRKVGQEEQSLVMLYEGAKYAEKLGSIMKTKDAMTNLASIELSIADIQSKKRNSIDELMSALTNYQKSSGTYETILEVHGDSGFYVNLLKCYSGIGAIYMTLVLEEHSNQNAEDLMTAIEYFEKETDIATKLVESNKNEENFIMLSLSYSKAGFAILLLALTTNIEEDRKRVLELSYEKTSQSIDVMEQVIKSQNPQYLALSLIHINTCYDTLIKTLLFLDEEENKDQIEKIKEMKNLVTKYKEELGI